MPSSLSASILLLSASLAFGQLAATSSCAASTLGKLDITKLPAVIAAPIYFQYAAELHEQAQSFRNPKAKEAALRVAFKRYAELANAQGEGNDRHAFVWPAQAEKMACYRHGEGVEQDYATALALAIRLRNQHDDLSSKWLGQLRVGLLRCFDAYSLTGNSISCKGYADLTAVASQTDNIRAQQLALAYISSFKLLKKLLGDEQKPIIETASADNRQTIFPHTGKNFYKITLPSDEQVVIPEAKMLLDYIRLVDRAMKCDSIKEYITLLVDMRRLDTVKAPREAKLLGNLLGTIVGRMAGTWLIQDDELNYPEIFLGELHSLMNPKFFELGVQHDIPLLRTLGLVSKFMALRDFCNVKSMFTFVRLVHKEENTIFTSLIGKRFIMIKNLPAIADELDLIPEYIAALRSIHQKVFQPQLNLSTKIIFYFLALCYADVARETNDPDYYAMSVIALNDYLATEGLAEYWANEPEESTTSVINRLSHDFPNVSLEDITSVTIGIARIRDHFQALAPYVKEIDNDESASQLAD